jgi:parvulin-like peptidyl-prolyl isomerase
MIPVFETVIFDMRPGEVSGIVHSDFGFHILKLVGMREAQVKVELADIRERIMNKLVMEKRETAYRELIDRLYESADVEYFDRGYAPDGTSPEDAIQTGPADTAEADTAVKEQG